MAKRVSSAQAVAPALGGLSGRRSTRAADGGIARRPLSLPRLSHASLIRACYLLLGANILLNLLWVLRFRHGLNDLGSFLHSGASYHEGLNPYSYHPFVDPQPISIDALNLNPPISVYPFEAMSRFDPSIVAPVFLAVSLGLLAIAVGLLMRAYPEKRNLLCVLVVLSLAGLWHMVWYLQLYAPLVLAMTGAWLLMRRGNLLWAGILIGLVVAIKPNYALLPLLLLVAGHRCVAVPAIATAAAVSVVPLLIDGPAIYRQWIDLTLAFDGLRWTSNASLISVAARFDFPVAGYVVGALLILGTFYWFWRVRPGLLDATAAGLVTVLLFGPVSWAGYTLLLLPFIFSRTWDRGMWFVVLLLAAPFSPQGAVSALNSLPFVDLELHLPPVHAALGLSLAWANAIVASVYAWAAVLLFVRLYVEKSGWPKLMRPLKRREAHIETAQPAPMPVNLQREMAPAKVRSV